MLESRGKIHNADKYPPAVIVRRVLDGYSRGEWSLLETVGQVFEHVSPENIFELIPLLPPDVLAAVRDHVEGEPQSDREWATARYFRVQSYCGDATFSDEEAAVEELRQEEWKDSHRKSVEALRRYFQIKREA
jgi:hypothetical protein